MVTGCALAAVGFGLWAGKVETLDFSAQIWLVVIARAGMGLMLTPASTDAVNRASRPSNGEATGITQTVRNYSASLGLAVLGTVPVNQLRSHVTSSLVHMGMPPGVAASEGSGIAQFQSRGPGGAGSSVATIPHFVRVDFAESIRTVFLIMAGVMAVAAVVALVGLPREASRSPNQSGAPRQGRRHRPGTRGPRSAGFACGPNGQAMDDRVAAPARRSRRPVPSPRGRPVS